MGLINIYLENFISSKHKRKVQDKDRDRGDHRIHDQYLRICSPQLPEDWMGIKHGDHLLGMEGDHYHQALDGLPVRN